MNTVYRRPRVSLGYGIVQLLGIHTAYYYQNILILLLSYYYYHGRMVY